MPVLPRLTRRRLILAGLERSGGVDDAVRGPLKGGEGGGRQGESRAVASSQGDEFVGHGAGSVGVALPRVFPTEEAEFDGLP
jgi:hypothetical protein